MSKSYFFWQLMLFILVIIASFCAYQWLDRSITFWAWQHHLHRFNPFRVFSELPELFSILIVISAVILYFQSIFHLSHPPSQIIYGLAACLLGSYGITFVLKIFFGRAGPRFWIKSHFNEANYGFFWFEGIHKNYQLFPSGHSVLLFVMATFAWFKFPLWRLHIAIISSLVIIGILGMSYHFLSDCIVGAYLGYLVGRISVYLLQKHHYF